VQPLLSGDAGVEQTINEMRGLVDEALHDPAIIRWAKDIVSSVPAFDDLSEAEAGYNWVRGNIRFTKDPVNKENLYPPSELLRIRSGDCDDISMLLATYLMAIGYPARWVTVAASPDAPEQFSHVYVESEVPAGSGNWIPMDPARYDSEFGVAPPVVTRSRWWSVADQSYGELSGMRRRSHTGSSVPAMLGNYPRYHSFVGAAPTMNWFNAKQFGPWKSFQTKYSPGGMSSYARPRTMGDDVTQQDVNLVSATGTSVSDIILASQGVQPLAMNPVGAGYGLQQPALALPALGGSSMWIWILLGVAVVAMAEKH